MAIQRTPTYDPFRDVERAQDFSREGVKAFGEMLRPDLLKDIGSTIGGLNEIGALRSGGTKVALDDLSRSYTDRIGQFASLSTQNALGQGLQGGQLRAQDRDQRFREDEAKRQRKAGLLSAIGSVVGAGVGFAADRVFPATSIVKNVTE
jgi:hypothetical protein